MAKRISFLLACCFLVSSAGCCTYCRPGYCPGMVCDPDRCAADCCEPTCDPCRQQCCDPCGDSCCDPCCHEQCGYYSPYHHYGVLTFLGRIFSPYHSWYGRSCGERYWGDFYGDPPDCHDPCDRCGNFTGRMGYCDNGCYGHGCYGRGYPAMARRGGVYGIDYSCSGPVMDVHPEQLKPAAASNPKPHKAVRPPRSRANSQARRTAVRAAW